MTNPEPFLSRVRLNPKYHILFHQLIPLLLAGRTIKEAAREIDQSVHECYRSIQFARFYYKSRTTFELVYRYLLETGQPFSEPSVTEPAEVAEKDRYQLELFL